jgi:hypothetical protein
VVTQLLARHLQPALGSLSAPQLHRLVAAVGALGVAPPPGFAAAAAAALQGRLVLLPKGRHLVTVLGQLMAWGLRPPPAFMRATHAAADLLLDTFSAASAFEFLHLCWDAAAPHAGRLGFTAAVALSDGPAAEGAPRAPLPPAELVSELLAGLDGRALSPVAAAEGLRLLGALRARPPPALLAQWLDACGGLRRAGRGGVPAAGLSAEQLLGALWGVAELRVAPPAAWLESVLEALAVPGRLAACTPPTLAALLRCLLQLGAAPAPALAAAAAEAAAAAPADAWDAESLSVLLACLALWDAPPPAGAPLRELALRAGAAAASLAAAPGGPAGAGPGGPATAARLFVWWHLLRARDDAGRLLGALEPMDVLSIDLSLWSATLELFPEAPDAWDGGLDAVIDVGGGGGSGGGSGSSGALPRGALAPLFVLGVASALREPGGAAPPAWFERAWAGGAAAAAAADALSAAEAAALLGAALGTAPGLHLWDLGAAQAVLRAGYRARAGAPSEALKALGFASDAMLSLVEAVPAYAASWGAALAGPAGAALAADGGEPGLPPACVDGLLQEYEEAAGREVAEGIGPAAGVAAAAGAARGGPWGDVGRLEAALQAEALGAARGVTDAVRDAMVGVACDASPGWLAAALGGCVGGVRGGSGGGGAGGGA